MADSNRASIETKSITSTDDLNQLPLRWQQQKGGRGKWFQTGCLIPILKFCVSAALLSIVIVAGILLILKPQAIFSDWRTKNQNAEWTSCGTTAKEAREANCHYEPMQRSWIPNACYFPKPDLDYDPFSDREWYSDENMTVKANIDRLRSGDEEMAYVSYFHDEHCIYSWRKLAIAVEQKRRWIDSKTWDMMHITHCAKRITARIIDSEQENYTAPSWELTESPLMFQDCLRLF